MTVIKDEYNGQHSDSREGLVDAWTRNGRVFIANEPAVSTPETMSATGTALTLTDPSIRFTVPAGVLVVPIHVQLAVVTVAAKDDIFAVIATASDSYASGGDAVPMLVKNAIINGTSEARATTLTNIHYSDTSIVEGALIAPRVLKYQESQPPATAQSWNPEYNILKGDPMVYLTGPASFLVVAVQETAPAEATFNLSWAELNINEFTP